VKRIRIYANDGSCQQIQKEALRRFGGYTTYYTHGAWTNDDNEAVTESSVVVEVMAPFSLSIPGLYGALSTIAALQGEDEYWVTVEDVDVRVVSAESELS
jgi:hypothetical protein